MIEGSRLGRLEQAVLNFLWEKDEGDAKSVHAIIGKKRQITLNTIQSTLERLFKKKLLHRTKIIRAYVYRPAIERNELIKILIDDMVGALKADKNGIILSAFMDMTGEVDSAQLEKLEKVIKLKKAQLKNEG